MSIMNSKERKARDRGRKQGYVMAIKDMADNLIRNSRTEVLDGKVTLIVTEDRIKAVADEMLKKVSKN